MEALLESMSNNLFWTGVFLLLVLWTASSLVQGLFKSRSLERTRREIAAYVAEGSMTSEEGERLLRAMPSGEDSQC